MPYRTFGPAIEGRGLANERTLPDKEERESLVEFVGCALEQKQSWRCNEPNTTHMHQSTLEAKTHVIGRGRGEHCNVIDLGLKERIGPCADWAVRVR